MERVAGRVALRCRSCAEERYFEGRADIAEEAIGELLPAIPVSPMPDGGYWAPAVAPAEGLAWWRGLPDEVAPGIIITGATEVRRRPVFARAYAFAVIDREGCVRRTRVSSAPIDEQRREATEYVVQMGERIGDTFADAARLLREELREAGAAWFDEKLEQ